MSIHRASAVIPPPPSSGWRLVPPNERAHCASPPAARDLYPLAQQALRRYRDRISESDRDDICQEIVIVACAVYHNYDPLRGTLRQWISGIARNCVRSHVRNSAREVLGLDLRDTPAAGDASRDDRDSLLQMVGALPDPGRTIVMRHDIEGKTFREIAAEMGRSLMTAHAHYQASIGRLRALAGAEAE